MLAEAFIYGTDNWKCFFERPLPFSWQLIGDPLSYRAPSTPKCQAFCLCFERSSFSSSGSKWDSHLSSDNLEERQCHLTSLTSFLQWWRLACEFYDILLGGSSLPELDRVGGDLSKSLEVFTLFIRSCVANAVQCFLSSVGVSVLHLLDAAIGVMRVLNVDSLFENLLPDTLDLKNFVTLESSLPALRASGSRCYITWAINFCRLIRCRFIRYEVNCKVYCPAPFWS